MEIASVSRYCVYVIELDVAALAERDRIGAAKGAVYVGYTSKTPEARLAQHQARVTPGKVFKRMSDPSASWLRKDLSLYAGPYKTEREARRNETRTHNRLKHDGYKVFGDRGKKLAIRPTQQA